MRTLCGRARITAILGLLFGLNSAAAGEAAFDTLEKQFRKLPPDARRLTGPLFWLHGDESKERLEEYVAKVAEGGNGCLTTESRPHKDWLGEGWFRDLAICLEAARKHNLQMWIFDEKWWPSGEVGGTVPAQYGSKRLSAEARDVEGPAAFTLDDCGGPNIVAVLAGKITGDGIDPDSLVDLAGSVRDGKLTWEAPAGKWKVMKFTWAAVPVGNRYLVDGASQEAVDWYLKTVYQPHYDRFKDDFGKHIVGFFYDEPETHGDWGTEVMKVLAERGVDFKQALVAFKFKLAGESQVAARYQYLDAFAEAWGRTMYGGITRWCRERNVKSIGHWLEHANVYVHPNLCAGNMFQLQKYSDMGGIDAVFDQFKIGQRVARDAPCWQTPKLGSSITHAYGKPDDITMVEIFGARGQDLTYPEMKWWTDHMHVSGVNFMIPHSFNPRAPRDTDCPPYFRNGGFEPRWPLYRVYADYTSRLSLLLTGGRHVCPVALLYPGHSVHVGKHILPDVMSEVLQDALYDCDWLPYDVFENDVRLGGKELKLREESYRVLILPAVEVIPYATLAKAKEFFDRGGVVLAYGILPEKSATLGKNSADIATLREALWGQAQPGTSVCKTSPAGGRSYFLPEKPIVEQIQAVLAADAGIRPTLEVLEGRTDNWLHVLHRVKAGRDVFFITNQNHTGEARKFRFRITAQGEPECWDAMRNEITAVPYQRQGDQVELTLTMEPSESLLLVFAPKKRPLPTRLEPGGAVPATTITLQREATPPPAEPELDADLRSVRGLESCSWVWYPEGNPAANAPAGKCYFRKRITIPADRRITSAAFTGTADNSFVLFVNGREAGRSDDSPEGWRRPVHLRIQELLQSGENQLAIMATNAAANMAANPAGLIGQLTVNFETGDPLTVRVDKTWKVSRDAAEQWMNAQFDDADWVAAGEFARFGDAPWGRLRPGITLSPVKADPFIGHCEIPASADLGGSRVYLEMDPLTPEEAARVTVNGRDAGGFIGRPLRLEITSHLKPGANIIRIEPFAPAGARLAFYPREDLYTETYRPQFHFTARENWLNDPNGLVYYKGEYHLFFQHNPTGINWGNMTWGHAVSTDLLRWKQLPNAIEPDDRGTIFSGSAVVDWENTSGFRSGAEKPLVAIYTAAGGTSPESRGQPFTQCIAYSNDRGRTWTKFPGNPVLEHIVKENRDPKVIWHEPTRKWIMALYKDGDVFALFNSPDLKTWTHLHDLSMPGCNECPDFFEMPVDKDRMRTKWVFTAANGHYLVGTFDGLKFTPESGPHPSDYGRNFYAVQTFSDIPGSDGRRIQIAWMRGGQYPGMPFNQQMSIPCELQLRTFPEGLRLIRRPVKELKRLRVKEHVRPDQMLAPGQNPLAGLTGDLLEIVAEIEPREAREVGFRIRGEAVAYKVKEHKLTCLGAEAPLEPKDGRITLQILVDRTSIEVFGNDGRVSMTSCFLPPEDNRELELYAIGSAARVVSLKVYELGSVWQAAN